MTLPAMLGTEIYEGSVKPEWIDLNQHMNVAYYVMAFDLAIDSLWKTFGLTDDYISGADASTFAVECHLTWQKELHEGDAYIVTAQIMAYDDKRIHQFQRLYHANGFLAATAEWMNLHVSLESRRVSLWPPGILERIAAFAAAQRATAMPAEAGHRMSIANPLYRLGQGG